MSATEAILRRVKPEGRVIVYFRECGLTSLRFNDGGANEGWWFGGESINRNRAEELLEKYSIRAVVNP